MSKAVKVAPKRAVVAAVQLPKVSDLEFEASLNELRELAKTLGFEVVATFTQKRTSFDSTAYLGLGKREELRRYVQGEAEAEENPLAEDSPAVPVAKNPRIAVIQAKIAMNASQETMLSGGMQAEN
jgi:GTP-binding protein HflX